MMATEPGTRRRRPRRPASARLRILGGLLFLLALAGAVGLLLQHQVLLQQLDDDVERQLVQEAEELRVLADGVNPATGQPFAGDVAAIFDTFLERNIPAEGETLITFVDGRPWKATPAPHDLWREPDLVQRWRNLTTTQRGDIETPAGPVRYLAVPLSGGEGVRGVFVVANFLRGERLKIERTTRVGAGVYGSVLVVAAVLAWFVAGRVLAPVRLVTETARELTDSDLSRRIEVPPVRDEVAQLAETFNGMLDRLESAFEGQRQLLRDVGHELRTPITIIRGNLELEQDDPAARASTRAIVLDELDRMARIVEELLLLARSEAPDFLDLAPVDLDLLTLELFGKVKTLAPRDWRLVATGHGVVVADRHRLTQAVMNLAENAVRHTDPGAPVELGSALEHGEVRLWISDHGPGIPAADQTRIFERFARADGDGAVPGTAGLGLAIVRAVAEAHGGTATVRSSPGEGATFTITVPVDPTRSSPWRAS